VSQLPPPPSGPLPPDPGAPWTSAPRPSPQVPRWRTGGAGWVILHVVIGLGIGLGLLIVSFMIVASAHFDLYAVNRLMDASRVTGIVTVEQQRMLTAIGGAFLLELALSVLAWLLFVYLRSRTLVRASLLIGRLVSASLISYGILAGALPKLAGY
jgi:hypothetical protein